MLRPPLRALTARRERSRAAARYFIKAGYRPRERANAFVDVRSEADGVVHQPHVYPFAARLAAAYGCSRVIDLGCGRAHELASLPPGLELVGVDLGHNVERCREAHPFGEWIEWDLEQPGPLPISRELARGSVVVCADVVEHLVDPTNLLANLRRLLQDAPVALLSTPDRDLVAGAADPGPPADPHHVREWSRSELAELLEWAGLRVDFLGLTAASDRTGAKTTSLAVLAGRGTPSRTRAPKDFRAVALMCAYNEADVIESTIRHLVGQGLEVYVLDNWSSDSTAAIVERYVGRGVIGTERFPAAGPDDRFDLRGILRRFEELALELPCDWCVHVDADERRLSPWAGTTLRDALHHVDRSGFNCIDHTVLVFHPAAEVFPDGGDPERLLAQFEFGARPGHFLQLKGWKNLGVRVDLESFGGHEVCFEGKRLYPHKFLLKHYPIRSQAHGVRKVFGERLTRWSEEERELGWHVHYDHLTEDHAFVRDAAALLLFEEPNFSERYLVERLSGIGILSAGR